MSSDSGTLNLLGHDLVQQAVCLSIHSFFFAIYTVLVYNASRILLKKKGTRVSLITLAAVCFMFTINVINWVIDFVHLNIVARLTLIDNPGFDLATKYSNAVKVASHWTLIQTTLASYLFCVGDAIIIWRVGVFWPGRRERLVMILPCAILLGNFVATIMITYCVGNKNSVTDQNGVFEKPAWCANMQTTTFCTSAATTAVATILISIKAWGYRRSIRSVLKEDMRRTFAEKVMFILIESGLLYFVFFFALILISISKINAKIEAHIPSAFALTAFEYLSSVIAGIYPTAIILLVHSQCAVLDPVTLTRNGAAEVSTFRVAGASTVNRSIAAESNTQVYDESEISGDRGQELEIDLEDMKGKRLTPSRSSTNLRKKESGRSIASTASSEPR